MKQRVAAALSGASDALAESLGFQVHHVLRLLAVGNVMWRLLTDPKGGEVSLNEHEGVGFSLRIDGEWALTDDEVRILRPMVGGER